MGAATEAQLAEWIAAIAGQDERALAGLYDETVHTVYGLVLRIVRNAATAEEVVEDAYFQVWRQAVRFDPTRGNAMAWLLAMARSRALDALRHEACFRHDSLDPDDLPDVASEAPPVDELLDLARHRADLHQALLLLGTVKSQIRRALLSLRQLLEPASDPPLVS